jgi:DivIVA domain-containing protein
MELERHNIERSDFPPSRRGYDPDEVDRHLRQIAEAVERLKAAALEQPTVSGVAAERVQAIVAVAEASAREIEQRASEDAGKALAEAASILADARANADTQAREHLERVERTAGQLIARASELQKRADELLGQLTEAAAAVVDSMRGGAEDLRAELEAMRAELADVREAAPAPPPARTARPAARPEKPAAEAVPPVEPEVIAKTAQKARAAVGGGGRAGEGARLIALNMALSGTPREETARYLAENFDLADQDDLLDEVYARAGG